MCRFAYNNRISYCCPSKASLKEANLGSNNECEVFLFGADPYPEINGAGLYKGTQIFYAPDGLESFIQGNNEWW